MFWLKIYLWIWLGLLAAVVLFRGTYIWDNEIASRPTRATKITAARDFLLPLCVVTLLWPVTLPILLWGLIDTWRMKPYEPPIEPRFAPTIADLGPELTVETIEQTEIYSDPLDAVPRVPFGHLNGAWRDFRDGLLPEAMLWRYEARWENQWGDEEIHAGYAEVKDGAVIRFFDSNITHRQT